MGHTQSFYTPWDSREEGRRPINFTGRTELQARNFKEELKLPGESTLRSFGILTYGTGLSTVADGGSRREWQPHIFAGSDRRHYR